MKNVIHKRKSKIIVKASAFWVNLKSKFFSVYSYLYVIFNSTVTFSQFFFFSNQSDTLRLICADELLHQFSMPNVYLNHCWPIQTCGDKLLAYLNHLRKLRIYICRAVSLTTRGLFYLTWVNLNPNIDIAITCPVKCGMRLLLHSQTSTAAPSKFGNWCVISSNTLWWIWLLNHAGIGVNTC